MLAGLGGSPSIAIAARSSRRAAAGRRPSCSPTSPPPSPVAGRRSAASRADELARVRKIQKYELDGYRALFHTVEHMSYHTGQIVLLAKLLGATLDFYPQHRGE